MSQFSEYLKILVEESGSSVSALARASGLNRPNLQNVIGAAASPPGETWKSCCPSCKRTRCQLTP